MGEDGGGNGSGGGGHGGASGGAGVAHAGNGEVGAPHAPAGGYGEKSHGNNSNTDGGNYSTEITRPVSPPSRGTETPNPFSRKNTSLDLDDYFSGPRDISKHSKWPLFLQLHGSITPKMIVPLLAIGAWATLITVLSKEFYHIELSIEPVLLTITGFVVSMGLSLRSSTAYERYAEGRRCWSQLILASQSLGRVFWVHAIERPETAKEDLLGKLTAMNLIIAYAVALKHKLRFEPYTHYEDLIDLVGHIDTLAKEATADEEVQQARSKKYTIFKAVGENLGLSFATSNPRKQLKRIKKPVGNLPLEILCYLTAYSDELVANGQLPVGMQQTTVYNNLGLLNDVMVNTERVLNTPLPIAYAIVISQITWLYVVLLPFQLYAALDWITIPATIFASYIILGIFFIGHEIENPFGNDVNDLPLDSFCQQIVDDMETISSRTKISTQQLVQNSRNKVLYPYSNSSYYSWAAQSEGAIRTALKNRPNAYFEKAGAPSLASGPDNV
ncbi:Bestrophin, RFP-TM, chloride channel-domain-containing protein [Xylaria bambusicola]|uniref:Bestrophin, RFP-TM, chloride channel-domain-containing protein n=1 Tax=Xylaria bambusicola TaxID=326684 RepID=UPI00200818F0|nr:Bestrophin, RFP-TM, chloride channel-domain-containing protein [Xylaria bambusicola]KAI0505740.1 Bestrophin, RFP-TM, chloride channel-domain-containing protein [Xylaria bambusicola]